ncbi:piggyBac transposable element-derived protein 3-like, partial [Bactrocera neohumeralis]|uniref:piggyBac transposable element-derived protein 3-like n=1 Tax=Bactrocera neohumeralis TaxID=98809 RepID=UPI002165AD90
IIEKIVIEPPSGKNIETDEDSGDEDGSGRPDNLPKAQLTQSCQVIMRNTAEEDFLDEALRDVLNYSSHNLDVDVLDATLPTFESSTSSLILEKTPSKIVCKNVLPSETKKRSQRPPTLKPTAAQKKLPKQKKKKQGPTKRAKQRREPIIQWVEDNNTRYQQIFPEPSYLDCVNLSPHEQFEKFFDDELIEMLCTESNSYAVYCGQVNPQITTQEMRVFIGILIVTGYSFLPVRRGYWSMKQMMISDAMRRNRFDTIFRSIHFIDNAKQQINDKIWKLRPYTDALKQRFQKHFHPERNLSYDESMIEYYGRHGCKQFIRGKPLRFGYKMWSLNTPLGYLINFEMYQGTNPRMKTEYHKYGKNITPLFCMLDEFDETIKHLEFSLHFDNLFTTTSALVGLKERGYQGTGTIRENMIPKSCPLNSREELKKRERGHVESAIMKDTGIKVTKWVDNAV